MNQDDFRFRAIFMPRATKKLIAVMTNPKIRFVHYTTADSFTKMLSSGSIWMRNARGMNDLSEVANGHVRIRTALYSDGRIDRLRAALNAIHPGLTPSDEILSLVDGHARSMLHDTYITCVSEHDPREDLIGRLSMWRAYSQGSVGVGVVLNTEAFKSETDVLGVYSSPVSYLTDAEIAADIEQIITNIDSERQWLATQDPQLIVNWGFSMFLFGLTCLKHPGFAEELEWRIIHNSTLHQSTEVKPEIVTLNGIPQRIYKIPLKDYPERGFVGASPNRLIERVIIGPSNYGPIVRQALIDSMAAAGVHSPENRIINSDIPLRVSH
ncbi:DUF2971 domain-containing protein [Mesorhizobium sp. YIM 152430]|uniref:DUF2971 domain-containing protein n=1 Tax=Mesorhizobium sp. YIM 152430 TaxID=3031761 RepID=UPI0023DA1544|nr:DUF2971 domain-containing protein [Mesorhizobium sp. YIM 152430]MDF1599640.1 DUF2971 domain-containing protein [Mesorhizobium sp. YIM 152430]